MNQSFYVGALGAGNCTEKFSVISNNLANVNSNGFKPKTSVFSQLVSYNLNDAEDAVTELQAGAGMKVQRTYTSFDTAGLTQTGSTMDHAILEPNAFFMVQDPATGAVSYTRDGHFHRAEREDGFYLMTDAGKLVLDQNREPLKADVTDVDKIQAEMGEEEEEIEEEEEDENEEDKPRVSLYTFANPSRLVSAGNNEYVPVDPGAQPILIERPSMTTGALEVSGTDMAKELVRMIECQRAFTYALRMVTTSDEIEGTINTLRG
ncbi:flagellar hook-basal body complex protein [Enterocloster sp. OA13]|uniref:flagellar hook-basal body protein n=1 Tax=Enterocloster sp. OA13 TaxID=2914161 RepID=UPI000472FBCE|nr:flagellar hook-basal body complex protein [Enterocloster sp. OA13]